MNHPSFLRLAAVAVASVAASCVDQDQKFFINPDGSGKMVTNMVLQVNPQQLAGLGDGAPKDMGKQVVVQLLRGAQGVEAWSDVSHNQTTEGKTKITATAYFPDINKFKMSVGGGGGGSSGASTLISRVEGGKWTIEIGTPDLGTPAVPPAEAEKKSPDQIKAAVTQAQQQWQATKAFMAPMMQEAKMRTTVVLGGTIQSAIGFSKEADNTALMQFNGQKMIDALDKAVMDPKIAEEAIAKGGDLSAVLRDQKRMQSIIMESVTDGQGMPRIVAAPGSPAFDYKAEVAKASGAQTPELKALLEEAKKPGGSVIRPPRPAVPGAEPEKPRPPQPLKKAS